MKARKIASLVWMLAAVGACQEKVPEPEPTPARTVSSSSFVAPTELVKVDVKVGDGATAKSGDKVKVHYTGRLMKNKYKFDSSVGKDPFEFTIGTGGVIKGWDQGVVGMKVGGKRELKIPAELAYGAAGSPPKIGKNEPLQFEIELLAIVADEPKGAGGGA